MSRPVSTSSPHLDIPRKSVELQDSGVHDLLSSEDEHFSDASEGKRVSSRPQTPASPIPKTRVERVDDEPAHGEVPGTPAYDQRRKDAVPDEIEVVPQGTLSKRASQISLGPPTTPGGSTIPRTVVEKIDPSSTSYGDDPNTRAWHHRKTDSVPDLVLKAPGMGEPRKSLEEERPLRSASPHGRIPETIITPVDAAGPNNPFGSTGSPTLNRPMKQRSTIKSTHQNDGDDNDDNDDDFGDDFDDFEEGDEVAADDDFGDFGDEFEEPDPATQQQPPTPPPPEHLSQPIQPLVDFEALSALPDLLTATQYHLDVIFPSTTEEQLSSLAQPEKISNASPIFPSDRSRSLWKQLVTPPPLQPPNWTQSRIRRLFLVSLGVPVDLDEILPPSKQKKLVLPDIDLDTPSRRSESDKTLGSIARLKAQAANDSTGSVDSTQSGTNKDGKPRGRKAKGPPPPPDLDLTAVKRLCATTDEKLDGLTDEELQAHVKQLELMTERTSEVLEYWLKRRDGLIKEKEAFEGVIENLVAHVRRVRR